MCPGFREGVRMFRMKSRKSHMKTESFRTGSMILPRMPMMGFVSSLQGKGK